VVKGIYEEDIEATVLTTGRYTVEEQVTKETDILTEVLQADGELIKQTLSSIDRQTFDLAVDTILKGRRIYIVGLRGSAPLAAFLGSYLNLICDMVTVVTANGAGDLFEQMMRVTKRDVVIGISFPRYSMRTLKAIEFAGNRQAKVITLTDNIHSPINMYSSCHLIAHSEKMSVVDSLVAPLSVINALVVALSRKKKRKISTALKNLEQIWDEYKVYNRDELNSLGEF